MVHHWTRQGLKQSTKFWRFKSKWFFSRLWRREKKVWDWNCSLRCSSICFDFLCFFDDRWPREEKKILAELCFVNDAVAQKVAWLFGKCSDDSGAIFSIAKKPEWSPTVRLLYLWQLSHWELIALYCLSAFGFQTLRLIKVDSWQKPKPLPDWFDARLLTTSTINSIEFSPIKSVLGKFIQRCSIQHMVSHPSHPLADRGNRAQRT